MEDIAFNDWPGQPVDLMMASAGANSWLPAYGFQMPQTMLDKDDFLGNPDAEYFLNGSSNSCLYLETIHEETSDDLRSDSDLSDMRNSPLGWLASDSETDSVICMEATNDSDDCESDREIACPVKRRRQDFNLLSLPSSEDDFQSLSRSSSLLQFETLEKQCQETSSSLSSQYSVDSLENRSRKADKKPRVDNGGSLSESLESSSSGDSETTLAPSGTSRNLKAWHSFEGLPGMSVGATGRKDKEEISAENLSEDSGYSDHMTSTPTSGGTKKARFPAFGAYDCEVFHRTTFAGNFGVSVHNLSVVDEEKKWMIRSVVAPPSPVNLDVRPECGLAKYNSATSASEPNLFREEGVGGAASVCSVPKDLDLVGGVVGRESVAVKNWDLADCSLDYKNRIGAGDISMATYKREGSYAEAMRNRVDLSDDEHASTFKGRPSSSQLSQPKTTMEDFDRKVLQAISESIQSINSSSHLSDVYLPNLYLPQRRSITSTHSTPNLAMDMSVFDDEGVIIPSTSTDLFSDDDDERGKSVQDIVRKSTSTTSGMSDIEDRTLCEASSSKGVHFSPVVSEVNWQDNVSTTTAERESSFSLSSTPERETDEVDTLTKTLLELDTSKQSSTFINQSRRVVEPSSCKPLTTTSRIRSQSQPDMSRLRRRGSQLVKKDEEGFLIKGYVDGDGIQYKHTHLDVEGGAASSVLEAAAVAVPSTSASRSSHVAGGVVDVNSKRSRDFAVAGMEADGVVGRADHLQRQAGKSRAGKLGGFLSRLASFRFTNRKHAEQKGKTKKSAPATGSRSDVGSMQTAHQKVASKDDYIFIPLKGPSPSDGSTSRGAGGTTTTGGLNNNNNVRPQNGAAHPHPPQVRHHHHQQNQIEIPQSENQMSGGSHQSREVGGRKPPLPRVPPRVVGASVKTRAEGGGGGGAQGHRGEQHRRRRTIDSAESCPRPMEPMGLIETDLDTEVTVITSGANVKTRSLLNLGAEPRLGLLNAPGHHQHGGADGAPTGRPHKSMEFLLDKQNLKVVEPPENELQKGERVMSEHQLRVQRSLQKLNVPDWYKQNQVPREGFILKNKSGAAGGRESSRWTGTCAAAANSKTTSLSSLGSATSPLISSPTASASAQPFVRWSTSKLNSTASSPCASTRSSFNARQPNGSISPSSVRSSFSYRQPYLGWRSQERLSRPRTPAERLANSLLNQSHHHHHQYGSHHPHQQVQESPEIQSSIKEVTSAIVHYVSGLRPDSNREDATRSRSTSPRGSQKLCWLESSFVGIRPLDTPQTPVGLEEQQGAPPPPTSLRLELQTHNDVTLLNAGVGARPSPGSTTLEDVLDSLLGLPSSERAPSPSLQATASASTSPSRLGETSRVAEQFRRRSEGNEPAPMLPGSRRVSFQSSPVLQCRYSKCGKVCPVASAEGQSFKNCHNCSYTYCSRSCRRAHWEKHRKTCLFSRIGTLCRQVIAAIKEDNETLLHLSTVARRGYLSHGSGAVKCFFPCAERAEKFLGGGLSCLGELTYVRWPDLLPSEMGAQLYAELVQMCKSYNPDAKLVLYVSVCVVSETPASGAVKWERQLVSRCAKMRLSKDISIPDKEVGDNPETLILVSNWTERHLSEDGVRRLKEISVNNVQKQLKRRGVSLRRQHPAIFRQLCAYANGTTDKFSPVTVHPMDVNTGKTFMCIIMLEADPDSLRQVELAGVRVRTVDVLCAD